MTAAISWLLLTSILGTGIEAFLLTSQKPNMCDFDIGYCGYRAGTGPLSLKWTRYHVPYSVSDNNHLIGSAMIVKASSHNKPGDSVKLVSPPMTFPRIRHVAVGFWYNMVGTPSMALDVHITYGSTQRLAYSKEGSTKDREWIPICAVTSVSENVNVVTVVFEAVVKHTGTAGTVMIDDVTVNEGFSCQDLINTSPSPTPKYVTTVSSVNGGWSNWSKWSKCSTSCDLGTIARSRSCTNPVPTSGGAMCTGNRTETHKCSPEPCPSWSHWFDGACSSLCGNGTMERIRGCSTGTNSDCAGVSKEIVPCEGTDCI